LLIYVALIIAPLKFIQSSKLGAGKGKGDEGEKGPYAHRKFLKSDMSKSRRHVVAFPVNPNFYLGVTSNFNK